MANPEGVFDPDEQQAMGFIPEEVMVASTTDKGIQPDAERVRTIVDFQALVSVAGVCQFVGMANQVELFISNLSQKQKPIRGVLLKDSE